MSKSNKTVTVTSENLPVTFQVTTAFNGELENLTVSETDLFVMTHMEHNSYGHGTIAINELTNGLVGEAINNSDFTGKAGESLLIEVPNNPIKHVLLIGLGNPQDIHRTTICSMYRMIMDSATPIGAKKITIPFFSGLLLDINYRGLLAVLRCRVAERLRSGAASELEEIEILCTAQAKRHIVQGLSVERQLCAVCRDPKFQTGEK